MTEEEKITFISKGKEGLTALAYAARVLAEWAAVFEARGGAGTYGDDALAMVYLSNSLQEFLTPERQATIARLRSDF